MLLHEVVCEGCSRRHVMSDARAKEQRVMRCDCGQYVRLDRGLVEAPLPADLDDADHDEATRMVASLDEIEGAAEAFGLPAPAAPKPAASASPQEPADFDDDEATRMVSSPLKLSSLMPTPPKSEPGIGSSPTASSPTGSKPVWFVDLGGTGTIEMTIDKLIAARRSGKIGETAMVWRPGMARWRPVGTLIAAAGSGVARPGAEPRSKPSNPKINLPPPSLPSMPRREHSDPSLAVYDRPAKTLEFAADPAKTPPPATAPAGAAKSGPPKAPVRDPARARSVPPSNGSTQGVALAARPAQASGLGRVGRYVPSLPRWATVVAPASACLALAIAGALLVRSLRSPRTLPAMSSTPSTAAAIAVPKPEPTTSSASPDGNGEPIIDVDSLSLEKKRRVVRPKLTLGDGSEPSPPSEPAADDTKVEIERLSADEASEPVNVKSRDKRDAGAARDAGTRKNSLEDLGERDAKNPFYNPGF